jgi:probable selenium-dependent hydroxylase accessory protein YqeC
VAVVGQQTTEQRLKNDAGDLPAVVKDGGLSGERSHEGTEKLSMLPVEQLAEYMELADIVFLEADGSKRLPLKVPSDKEPVLLPQCDIVIALCGMSCLGHTLQEKCFRLAEAEALLGKGAQEVITEDDIARILTSDRGSRKLVGSRTYYMVLNQCDDAEQLEAAGRIADMTNQKTGTVVAASLLQ